ncbi:SDR family oxidoreductase [Solimonas sp. K1W22B-7]|uniref:SDR family oxidoreductase n=1 Tax=Solimonas sp. K1W22B-7 TaxID=2303331 RepID=UPI000E32E511|nr:SDR family oxidoreductase [Solimonas sp. K1W22B-7]AXQ28422.1 SDR family oxidoreductase [Solimonas sp. K1W22B-7]
MQIKGSVALVTGANRGLGLAFTRALLAGGAKKVYAAARDPASVTLPGVVPLRLDVTRPEEVAAAAAACGDVTLLVNNAGIFLGDGENDGEAESNARRMMDTNYHGIAATTRAFAPVLAANGGGGIVNMLSVLSWVALPGTGAYSASKAAAWALTNATRIQLKEQGTQVVGVHAGYIDTDMVAGIEAPKASPADVVAQALAALEAGGFEALADDISRQVKAGLNAQPPSYAG